MLCYSLMPLKFIPGKVSTGDKLVFHNKIPSTVNPHNGPQVCFLRLYFILYISSFFKIWTFSLCNRNADFALTFVTSVLRLLWKLLLPLVILCALLLTVLVLLVLAVRYWLQSSRNARRARDGRPTVAFFHPYCNAGGGGERVLWCAIRALQNR